MENVFIPSAEGNPGNGHVTYGSGKDRLVGDDKANALFGFRGEDVIIGRGGRDNLDGGTGNDYIDARDGGRDKVDCAAGNDRVLADPQDQLDRCEALL